MTEKRFTYDDGVIWENTTHNSRFEIFPSKAVELLNKYEDTEKRLYKYLKDWYHEAQLSGAILPDDFDTLWEQITQE